MATLTSPTLSKLLTNVRFMLNQPNPANSFWTDLELTEYINEAIRMYFAEVTMNNEGQFVTQTDLNIVSGTETVALPADCFEVRVLYKKISDAYIVLPYNPSVVSDYSTQGGTSSEFFRPLYTLRDNNLVLRPIPNFSETAGLRLEYIRFPETLVNGGDTMSTQVSPVFKQLIEMYAVYKAKIKESLVSGVNTAAMAQSNLDQIYVTFKDVIRDRSKYPQFTIPFSPEGDL